MKDLLNKKTSAGISTIELLIAVALLATIITAAVQSNFSLQYWRTTISVAHEALYLAKEKSEYISLVASFDFFAASTTDESLIDGAGTSCASGGLCYTMQYVVADISSCAKDSVSKIMWKLGDRYPTSTIEFGSYLINSRELAALGGDCVLTLLEGSWEQGGVGMGEGAVNQPQFTTGMDVFNDTLFVVSSTSPQLRTYEAPTSPGDALKLLGTATGSSKRINSIDVARDMNTGRTYAYVMQHSPTYQLGVFDVSVPAAPEWVTEVSLYGVPSSGSFPQGWRVLLFGNRLYVLTRETAGAELHIFDVSNPRIPREITSAASNLGRTVNDMLVREQVVNGNLQRYLFVAASAATKEVEVLDVTNDTPVSVQVIDLPGTEDASCLCLLGDTLYLGRKNSSGPELYRFHVPALLAGTSSPVMSEVGADILTLRCSGKHLFVSTNKIGAQFQVWESDSRGWSTSSVNAGRIAASSIPRLAPLGLEVTEKFIYAASQSASQPEVIRSLYPL